MTPEKAVLTDKHSWWRTFVFRGKSFVHTQVRRGKNLSGNVRRFERRNALEGETVVALSDTPLWNPDDNAENRLLTAGKIENLRIAVRRIHGIELPAGAEFSFWKHIGNPNIGKGYVTGREIREGCLIPTKAGGLCQLSNALYDAALQAGMEITERHRHTKVVAGSLAEKDRDATVKWNYVDLRFRTANALRIEAELTAERLIVRFKSNGQIAARKQEVALLSRTPSHLNDCYSCGNVTCDQHEPQDAAGDSKGRVTYLLDDYWPEFAAYVQSADSNALFFVSRPGKKKVPKEGWQLNADQTRTFRLHAFRRSLELRIAARRNINPFAAALRCDRMLARAMGKAIPLNCDRVVVSQNLLPFLYEQGALGGRSVEVLMTRQPAEWLHARLDKAHQRFPDSPTLCDFRAPSAFVYAESAAIAQAQLIITPHTEIAASFGKKARLLPWTLPYPPASATGKKILFPASAVARKGAYEMKNLAEQLGAELLVAGSALEYSGFWEGLPVAAFRSWEEVGIVVFPAWVEHQPRMVLKALALGIPVIVSSAVGIPAGKGVTVIREGDEKALLAAVSDFLSGG